MRSKSKTINRINNAFSVLQVPLESRTPVLYETICGLNAPDKMLCETASNKDIKEEIYSVSFKESPEFSTSLSIRKRRNFKLASVTLNNKELKFRELANEYKVENCKINGSGDKLKISYRSKVFHLTKAELLAFPFTDKQENVAFAVEVPDKLDIIHPNATALQIAEHMKRYFDFCREKGVISRNSPSLRIKVGNKNKATYAKIRVLVGKDKYLPKNIPLGISKIDNTTLCLRATSSANAKLYWKLLARVMDERFDYIFPFILEPFPRSGYKAKKILEHFKLGGKSLPYRRYFD